MTKWEVEKNGRGDAGNSDSVVFQNNTVRALVADIIGNN